ncbi:putative esterase [Annulohypoxylon truncatum]|uniref:putative esterase n=1 Tax=Annulohypoxylon truncatum TaxID=327061 RepID=UPI0020079D36|nr:putative esterase [Annulohypoxylon truncatum]KAI1212895.1 putative esterase [Annulohypoxylon truncatum]
MAFETKATIANFGGKLLKLQHQSTSTGTPMDVNLFLPPAAANQKVPVLIYLSGLTCTPQNCTEKGFFQAHAARAGIALVWPDTSPRGADLPGETASWDFGAGAGFYVDATQAPWSAHYKMETYVSSELPAALFAAYADTLDSSRVSITGHSMGGHGALTLYLKNPGKYRSVSAFAPIANPSRCPWGVKAFTGYLGDADKEAWKRHDATELVKGWKGGDLKALVDVGTGDNFYKAGQLLPENFEKAVKEAGVTGLELRYQPDYDHSYFFMSTFAGDHVDHAAKYLFA